MARKLLSGVMVALIAILSLFGSANTTYAATGLPAGGTSLSKYFFVEIGELPNNLMPIALNTNLDETKAYWVAIDSFISREMSSNSTTYDYYHLFKRKVLYDLSGKPFSGQDSHDFFRVSKGYTPIRENGYLTFQNAIKDKSKMDYLDQDGWATKRHKWSSISSYSLYSNLDQGTYYLNELSVFEKLSSSTIYDPLSPPGYALPGYTDPVIGSSGSDGGGTGGTGGTGGNNGGMPAPTRPKPPEDNWDIIGWFKYLLEWLVYVWDTLVWLLAQLGSKVGDLMTAGDGMVVFLSNFFGWMPKEITTLIGIGIICAIILVVFKR